MNTATLPVSDINDPKITITASAAVYLQKRLPVASKAVGLRFGLRTKGCSGFTYVLDIAESMLEDDIIVASAGLNLIIDRKQIKFLKGTIIDCVQDGVNEFLKFNNPNAKGECGCGESVNIEA